MFKTTCSKKDCKNKDITYYMPEFTELTICGDCKTELKIFEMSKAEFDKVFDYDPFLEVPRTNEI
jgi:hypothetical protein